MSGNGEILIVVAIVAAAAGYGLTMSALIVWKTVSEFLFECEWYVAWYIRRQLRRKP